MLHNKGQLADFGLSLLIALMIFMSGMLFINPLTSSIDAARADLSCSSASTISDGTKLLCLVVDTVVIYFIIAVISLAGGMVLSKLLI